MSTTFSWNIANLERYTADGVVFTVHYTVSADDNVYSSSAYGSVGLEAPEPDSMISFDSLTEEIVVGWVADKFGEEKVTEIEAALQAQLDEKHAPSKAVGLPWVS
jgi:hypothetical protein